MELFTSCCTSSGASVGRERGSWPRKAQRAGESCHPEHWSAVRCICLGWTQPPWQWKEEGFTSAATPLPCGGEHRLPQAVLSSVTRKVMAH